jgi:NADH-quinone oxidoreductase subunit M
MILLLLIIIPLLGGLAAWLSDGKNSTLPRWIALSALAFDLALVMLLWNEHAAAVSITPDSWLVEMQRAWIPQLGISFHLALDGLSLILVSLTIFLGILAVLCSWTEINERVGFFHLNLLFILAGILGVFLSLDLFLFYFFWELMLVPMYFLINLWGHENRVYASYKFFIFTQAGGLLMLLSILGLYFVHGRSTGLYTFDYLLLLGTAMSPSASLWLMLGFFIAFAVKLPMLPFHPWLPDAHTEAPTAGSVILAGLLLKTGAYGLLRFVLPLFPDAVQMAAPMVMGLAVAGIVYGAVLAFGQTDLKRLVAYTSVSHMGFVLLGIFAGTAVALSGAVVQIVAHGVTTGALFMLVGMIQERIHTRDLGSMGGFWTSAPRLSSMGLLFVLASLGLPGTANFMGEFLVLLGTFPVNRTVTVIGSLGLVLSAVYSLRIAQRVFHGTIGDIKLPDLSVRETGMLAIMIIAIISIGLFPQTLLDTAKPVLRGLECCASHTQPISTKGGGQ